MDGVLLCGKYKNKKFSEIQDPGYCQWVLTLDDCAGSLADFRNWLRGKRRSQGSVAENPPPKRSRVSAWLEDSLGEELEELDQHRVEPLKQRQLPKTLANEQAPPGNPAQKIVFEGTLLLEVCSGTCFRVVGKTHGQNRFTSFLPRDLFNLLNSYRKRGEQQLIFDHAQYGDVLQLLKRSVQGGKQAADIEAIPTFVLLCFEHLRKFATRTQMQVKCANVLCGVNSPVSKNLIAEPNSLKALVGMPLLKGLRKFQRDGLVWGLSKNGRCLIGDEMGLGKTLQALAIIALYSDEWPALVVCPSSIRFQWRDQAKQWLPHCFQYPDAEIIVINNAKTSIPSCAKLVITSYELLVRSEALKNGFKVIVCDESHYIKSPTAKRSRTLVPMLQSAKRAVLLSGTPALNKPVELYQQLLALLPDFANYKMFAERYCDKKKNHWSAKIDYFGARLRDELNVLLRNTVMIRRMKKEVETELPEKLRSRVPIEMPAAKLELIKMKMSGLSGGGGGGASLELASEGGDVENPTARQIRISELFKMTGEFKAESVCEYVNDMLSILQPEEQGGGRKVIIFAHHHSVMDMIETLCLANRRSVRIDGRTPIAAREGLVKKFQERDEADVALLSITACGHGLNLTAAEVGIFAELYWVPGQIMQAEDRLHRIGSAHQCINIYYCLAQGTLDDVVWKILVKKWEDVSTTLNGEKETWEVREHCPSPYRPRCSCQQRLQAVLRLLFRISLRIAPPVLLSDFLFLLGSEVVIDLKHCPDLVHALPADLARHFRAAQVEQTRYIHVVRRQQQLEYRA